MIKALLLASVLAVAGCSVYVPGDCVELADGSGRKGTYIGFRATHKMRMHDTGNVIAFYSADSVRCEVSQ